MCDALRCRKLQLLGWIAPFDRGLGGRPIQVRGAGAAAANAGGYATVDEVIAHAWLRLFLSHAAVFSWVCCGSLVFHRCLILLVLSIVVVYLAAGVLDDVIVHGAVR